MKLTTNFFKMTVVMGLLVFSFNSYSQTKTDSIKTEKVDTTHIKIEKKLRFGTGFGLNFVGGTNISVAPHLTYNFNEKLAVGVGVQFNYLSIKDVQTTTSYGANSIFEYKPTKKILTLAEFVQLRVSAKSDIGGSDTSFWDSALFLGAGYFITEKISLGAKYNVLYDEDESIYSSAIIPFVNIAF